MLRPDVLLPMALANTMQRRWKSSVTGGGGEGPTPGSLGPPIAAHVLINLVIEPWLVLAAVSGATGRPEPNLSTGKQ